MIIEINTLSATPIYEQLRDQVVFGIAAGKLAPDEALPSARNLAVDLGINFHTVAKAYAMLCDEGYIVTDRRRGSVAAYPAANTAAFKTDLTRKLSLTAAEAICHGMNDEAFTSLCAQCFKNVQTNQTDGGIS